MESPTSKRKEREKEARKEAILEAAARVFSRKSFYEATLDEIAAEAELAKGTLYNYYKDKQDIFLSLVEKGLADFQSLLEEAISAGGPLRDLLIRCFEASLKIVREHQYMYRLMLTAGGHLSETERANVMEEWHNQSIIAARRLADALATVPETSRMSERERFVGAQLVFSAVHILHHRQMMEQEKGSLKQEIEDFVRLLCRALTVE